MPSNASEFFNVNVTIDDFIHYDISITYTILAKLDSLEASSVCKTDLAVGGEAVLLAFGKNFIRAKNRPAKIFYVLSIVYSDIGSGTSVFSIYANNCGLSKTEMLGDGFGWLFLKAGNYMNNIGETLEGKRRSKGFGINRFLPRKQVKVPSKFEIGYRGLSFVLHSDSGSLNILSEIPYAKIIAIVGTVYTIYHFPKLLIKCSGWLYHYIEKNILQNTVLSI